MSRIGKLPIKIEDGIQVKIADHVAEFKGKTAELKIPFHPSICVDLKDGILNLTRANDEPKTKAFHGLYRALMQNAVIGLHKGWSKTLELNGVGYKAAASGTKLEMQLGYSHPIVLEIPKEVIVKVEKQTKITLTSADKELLGRLATKIRSYRVPEPYLGKGIKYSDEVIVKKAGKSGSGDKK